MRISAVLAVCGAVLGACGGQVSGSPDAGGGDGHASSASSSGGSTSGSGGGTGSGSGGPVPLCPPDPPTTHVACASPGQGCAYMLGGQCEGYRCTSSSGWEMDPTVTCP